MSYGMTLEQMQAELEARLKPSRFRHSLGVSETAVKLSHRFGVDEEKARVAGLLHDCAREFRNEAMAIARHTVGGAQMTPLDKIIWYADMIEPNRDFPGVDKLRELAKTASLDEMMLAGLSHSIIFVVQKGHLVHPATVLARNEILLGQMKRKDAEAEQAKKAKKED